MEKYVLNETPLRTSNNFGINNIEIVLDIPSKKTFNGFNVITEDISKIKLNVKEEILNKKGTFLKSSIGLNRNVNYIVKVNIPENTIINENIKLEFNIDEDNDYLVEDIEIVIGKNSSANFEILYNMQEKDIKAFHNGLLDVKLKEGAKSKIIISNMLNHLSDNIYEIQNELSENANLEYILIDFGGKTKISKYNTKCIGDNSKNLLNVIYLGKEKDVIDINYIIETYGIKSQAYINVQGALANFSKKNFKGTIDFKEGSKKSVGKENENCMILSKDATSKSLPMLLCHEEDVEGEHGVSCGKIDEKKLFYIMTKGINYNDAKKLIIKANFSGILEKIDDDELKDIVDNEISKI